MIHGLNHITMAVSDLDKSFEFYTEILGFKALAKRKNKSVYLLAGENWVALVLDKKRTASNDSYAHVAFSVDAKGFQTMSEKIKKSGARIWQENSSPGDSLYFLDPSGNKLEIHSGNWQSRLEWLREHPSPEVTIYGESQ